MIVCHCKRVSHRKVLEVVQNGARTPAEVGRACGAGTCCGGCTRTICEIIREAEPEREDSGVFDLTVREELAYA